MTRSCRSPASWATARGCGSTARLAVPGRRERRPRIDGQRQAAWNPLPLAATCDSREVRRGRWHQRHLPVPTRWEHSWAYWARQLQALKPDLITTLNG